MMTTVLAAGNFFVRNWPDGEPISVGRFRLPAAHIRREKPSGPMLLTFRRMGHPRNNERKGCDTKPVSPTDEGTPKPSRLMVIHARFLKSPYFVQRASEPFHSPIVVLAVTSPRIVIDFLTGVLAMEIAGHNSVRSYLAVRNHDGLIKLAYIAFAIIAIVVLYFASGGPGNTGAELALATALP
jgi:hypothetical protein